jgi:hypothetical protein
MSTRLLLRIVKYDVTNMIDWLINWVLTPLWAVFQLYHGDQVLVVDEASAVNMNTFIYTGSTVRLITGKLFNSSRSLAFCVMFIHTK